MCEDTLYGCRIELHQVHPEHGFSSFQKHPLVAATVPAAGVP